MDYISWALLGVAIFSAVAIASLGISRDHWKCEARTETSIAVKMSKLYDEAQARLTATTVLYVPSDVVERYTEYRKHQDPDTYFVPELGTMGGWRTVYEMIQDDAVEYTQTISHQTKLADLKKRLGVK